jgi:hypothetical protein
VSLPRLRAPREHGQILAVPPLRELAALLARNQRDFAAAQLSILGRSLTDLRTLARREIVAASTQYHHEAGEPIPDATSATWLVAGHQPELFHPGVWFKNFAQRQLAEQHGAMSLNLVVDTDTVKPAILHAPSEGRIARIPFDRSTSEMPYEERIVEEEAMFAELPARMSPIVAHWNFEAILAAFWAEVMKQAERTPLMGERFAGARRAMERRWGCVQREIPISRVCQTEAFAWFACSIIDDLPAFHSIYNQTVQDYRRENDIRSRSHPVPDLAVDGNWLEAPFWAWRTGQKRRGKLFVRRTEGTWTLRAGKEEWPSLPANAIEAWRSLEAKGYKIRSRALTTTMFARLFLADVFIHGIGGGIYDELTDRLIERYFRIPAPGFVVLSATLLLPLPRYPDATQGTRALARKLRDLVYKPELFTATTPAIEALVQAKREAIRGEGATHAERVERFKRIRELNAELLPFVADEMQCVHTELVECRRLAEWDTVAARRDYPFCLYPEAVLREAFHVD